MIWVLLVLPLVILIPIAGDFLFQPGADYSDLVISHYPNALFLIQSLREMGTVPLWSDTILSGYPFAANPLSGLWYPAGWLALILPLPLGFNLTAGLHMLFGGIGMFRFLRSEGAGITASLLAGVAMVGLPKTWAHLAAGHLTLVYAVSWTPWLLLAQMKSLQRPSNQRFRFWPAIVFALILLADVRWAAYAGFLWLGYCIWKQATDDIGNPGLEEARNFQTSKPGRLLKSGMAVLIQMTVAILLAAPLLLPLAEYASLSTRGEMTTGDSFALSLPPGRLLGIIFPDLGGYAEWISYPTAGVLLLSIWAITQRICRIKAGFWLGVVLSAIIFALGSNIPLLDNLALIPGISLLRVPPRALFLADISMIILAAWGFQDLISQDSAPQPASSRLSRFAVLLIAEFAVLTVVMLLLTGGSVPINFVWGTLVISLTAAGIFLWLSRRSTGRLTGRFSRQQFAAVMIAVVLLDGVVVNGSSIEGRAPREIFSQSQEIVEYLSAQPGIFRVYSPSYSLPQQANVLYDLHRADGIDPLQLKAYTEFMEKATGVPPAGYSVTLPPFKTGDPGTDNLGYLPDATRLGWLNVRYIAAEYDLDAPELVLVTQTVKTRLYQNRRAFPYAWTQDTPLLGAVSIEPALVVERTPNRVLLEAYGPGVLILSEVVYPGWDAAVDGEPVNIRPIEGILRGVNLGGGKHRVEFVYRPRTVYLGLCITGVTLIALIGFVVLTRRKEKGIL